MFNVKRHSLESFETWCIIYVLNCLYLVQERRGEVKSVSIKHKKHQNGNSYWSPLFNLRTVESDGPLPEEGSVVTLTVLLSIPIGPRYPDDVSSRKELKQRRPPYRNC